MAPSASGASRALLVQEFPASAQALHILLAPTQAAEVEVQADLTATWVGKPARAYSLEPAPPASGKRIDLEGYWTLLEAGASYRLLDTRSALALQDGDGALALSAAAQGQNASQSYVLPVSYGANGGGSLSVGHQPRTIHIQAGERLHLVYAVSNLTGDRGNVSLALQVHANVPLAWSIETVASPWLEAGYLPGAPGNGVAIQGPQAGGTAGGSWARTFHASRGPAFLAWEPLVGLGAAMFSYQAPGQVAARFFADGASGAPSCLAGCGVDVFPYDASGGSGNWTLGVDLLSCSSTARDGSCGGYAFLAQMDGGQPSAVGRVPI